MAPAPFVAFGSAAVQSVVVVTSTNDLGSTVTPEANITSTSRGSSSDWVGQFRFVVIATVAVAYAFLNLVLGLIFYQTFAQPGIMTIITAVFFFNATEVGLPEIRFVPFSMSFQK